MNILQRFWWYFGVTYPLKAAAMAPQKFLPKKNKMDASRYIIHLTKIFIKPKSSFDIISSCFAKKIWIKNSNLWSYG